MVAICFLVLALAPLAQAQIFAGGSAGISTLSGSTTSKIDTAQTAFASYSPANGLAAQALFGRHWTSHFSTQAAYVFNRNALSLTGSTIASGAEQTFVQNRSSSQHGVGVDAMIYFRSRRDRFRPYVAGGVGLTHWSSDAQSLSITKGSPLLPPSRASANEIYWRTAVGLDFRIHPQLALRYSFWETLSRNPAARLLNPKGDVLLMNFQSQFGLIWQSR